MITVIQACRQKEMRYQKNMMDFKHVVESCTPEGPYPSQMRNLAAQSAKGDILLFLDDDSSITQETIDRYQEAFCSKKVDILGGPALIRDDNPFKYVLESFWAFACSRSRYRATGVRRLASERELILCNLAIRKECFLSLGGFNEDVYPWEENDLLRKAQKKNIDMFYDPELITERGMTKSLKVYLAKIISYAENRARLGGVDRVEYMIALFFLPFIFMLYRPICLILFLCYLIFLFADGIWLSLSLKKSFEKSLYTMLTHVSYSFGLWKGLLSRLFFIKRFRHLLYTSN